MKTKPFIFVLFLYALIFLSVVAIESSKDEKQTNAFDMSKTKLALNKDVVSGGGHDGDKGKGHEDGEWGFWINDGGGWGAWLEHAGWKGWIKNEGVSGGGGGGGRGEKSRLQGQHGKENEVSSREGENIELEEQGGRENEENWRRGENRRIRGEYLENQGPVWRRETNKGFGGRNGGGHGQVGLWNIHKN
ncbi:unnamed protein product [Lathyrus oleraceus]